MPDDKTQQEADRYIQAVRTFTSVSRNAPGTRRSIHKSDGCFVRAILQEIGETVLHRKLVFFNSIGAEISLDVTERRILSILSVSTLKKQGPVVPIDTALNEQDSELICKTLEAFCSHVDTVYVSSHLPDQSAASDFDGISVRDIWPFVQSDTLPGLPQKLENVLDASKPLSIAMVLEGGPDDLLRVGDVRECDALLRVLPDLTAKEEEVNLWRGGTASDRSVIHIKTAGRMLLILCEASKSFPCFDLWRSYVRAQISGPVS